MKRIAVIIAFLFIVANCLAQGVPADVLHDVHHIISLIKNNKADKLSKLVKYPLKRDNPLPDILTAKQFIAYYPTMFDAAFQEKLKRYNDSDVFEHHGQYGLVGGNFDGDIWFDENGKLATFNYSSQKEQSLKNDLTKSIQSKMYPTVNTWTTNILVCRSKNLLIRIDDTKNGIRYLSWNKGHTMADKPDLVLDKGVDEAQGMQGGWTWTFTNGDWTYMVDDVEMAEKDSELGYFLELSYKGTLKSTVRLEVIK